MNINPLDNTDDSHDPFFSSPDEFDIAYEDRVSSDPDDDSDEGEGHDDYWFGRD